MYTPEQAKLMLDLFANPMFKQGADEFFKRMQQEGMEAARKFWGASPYATAFPDAQQLCERMADFYAAVGFVPMAKHQEIVKENDNLKAENKLLRDTLHALQQGMIAEGGVKAQQAWQEVVDKQLEMNREVARGFFDVMKQFNAPK